MTFLNDVRVALRSLLRTKGLTVTVVLTLALGIGANAAIFSLVRGVLLTPARQPRRGPAVYIRQSAQGIGAENATFSVPEIQDLRERVEDPQRVRRLLHHRLHDGRPRRAARGPRGRRGRIVLRGDGPAPRARPAARAGRRRPERRGGGGADPSLLDDRAQARSRPCSARRCSLGARLGHHRRGAGAVGALSRGDRDHRQRRDEPPSPVGDDGHRAGPPDDGAVRRGSPRASISKPRAPSCGPFTPESSRSTPRPIPPNADFRIEAVRLRDQITSRARTVLLVLLAAAALVFVIACSNVANLILARTVRREGELAIRAALGASSGRAAPHAAGREPPPLRRGRRCSAC